MFSNHKKQKRKQPIAQIGGLVRHLLVVLVILAVRANFLAGNSL
jgi:hypothetical protein